MSGRICQERDDFQHLHERSRPPVREYQRKGRGPFAAFVDEVNPGALWVVMIVTKGRKLLHLQPPVKFVLPVTASLAEKVLINSVLPPTTRYLVGPPNLPKPILKVVQSALGKG